MIETKQGILTQVDAEQLDTTDLMWRTSWCQKWHIKIKIPFAAMLVKHTNNPIWRNCIFFNDGCNKMLLFDCGSIIYTL